MGSKTHFKFMFKFFFRQPNKWLSHISPIQHKKMLIKQKRKIDKDIKYQQKYYIVVHIEEFT